MQAFVLHVLGLPIILPLSVTVVTRYIAYNFIEGYAASTLRSHCSVISFVHKIRGMPDPTDNYVVKSMLTGFLRSRPSTVKKLGISHHMLRSMIYFVDKSSLAIGYKLLIRTLMLVAYYGAFRVGELISSSNSDQHSILASNVFRVIKNGKCVAITLYLKSYKFSNGKISRIILTRKTHIDMCPVHSLLRYAAIRNPGSKFLFTLPNGALPTRNWFSNNIKYILQSCGYDHCLFDTHSFRIGITTDLAEAGCSILQIKSRGRWDSFAFLRYIRPQSIYV